MTIQLTSEQEQVVGLAIDAGLIRSADEVVGVGIETIRRRLAQQRASVLASAEQWNEEFHHWVHTHPTDTPLLSDEVLRRESMYGARGQ